MTKNDQTVIDQHLRELLGDTFGLYAKTHAFHWNVTGPMFETLHLLFERQYTELWEAADEIAERLRAVKSFAPATLTDMLKTSAVKEQNNIPAALDMVRELASDHRLVAGRIREAIPTLEDAGDDLTADLFVARGREHEKTAWMLESLAA